MGARKIMPTSYLLVALLIMISLHLVLPLGRVLSSPWHLVGMIPLGIGLALNLIADRAFHRVSTPVRPLESPAVLLQDGVFRITRNPMYLGFVLALLGIAVLLGSVAPFVVVPGFAALMDRVFISIEEANLERCFGEAWLRYRSRVRRWF